MGCLGECDRLLIEPRDFSMMGNPKSVCLIRHSCESRNPELDIGLSPNAVDLGRMPLIQKPCFRRGLSLVIPAEAGIQVFLIFPGPRPSPG